ncbi:MAG: CPBP family intramembrane metalloprotease [Myxococcales bacterium]|nr:CPBP family intramembrane metalloprotease [Myxococcales bacterium]
MSRPALVVYTKELLDTLRDRRTLATMILVPMVVYPATLLLTTETMVATERAAEEEVLEVGAAPALPPALARHLAETPHLHLTTLSTHAMDAEEARQALKEGLHAVVVLTATGAEALAGEGTGELQLYVDTTQALGAAPLDRVQAALQRFSHDARARRLDARGLSQAFLQPLSIHPRSVATTEERGNHALAMALPSLVLLFVALSSLYPAIDLTAGEKERRTIATLLTTPVPLADLVAGKLLAVVTVGTLAGLLNVAAVGLTFLRVLGDADATSTLDFALSPLTVLGLFGAVLAAAFPLGALLLLFSAFARSFRDANLLLTPVLLVAMLPAGVVLLPGAELDSAFALVPIANAALWMKALLTGAPAWDRVLLVLLSSGGLTAVLGAGVVRVFSDERALFATEGRRADFARLLVEPPTVGMGTALAFAALAFAVTFFAGLLGTGPLVTIGVTQAVGYLIPAVLLARWMKGVLPPRALLALGAPAASGWAAAALVGAGAWLGISLPGGWLTDWMVPGQSQAAEAFAEAMGLGQVSLPMLVLAAAVMPAVAEELAFRGVVFRLLGAGRGALLGQAALFGLMHGSVYRFLPTAALGLCLGALRKRTGSVWPGVLVHLMTNATLLTLETQAPQEVLQSLGRPTPWALLGAATVILGLALARRRPA